MTEINYTHIVLDAIYEHSKFSSNFIKRECLKAKEKHIDNEEFYSSLLGIVEFFEKKINDLYASHLNRYFIYLNEDKLLPKESKIYYPKPEIKDIGMPLFEYYCKYRGHIFIADLVKIKRIIHEVVIGDKKNKRKKISAPTIALFCQLVNHSGIIKQGEYSNEAFCKKVILEFKLNANPNTVRKYYKQNLDLKKSNKKLNIIYDLIFPVIPNKITISIKNYISC